MPTPCQGILPRSIDSAQVLNIPSEAPSEVSETSGESNAATPVTDTSSDSVAELNTLQHNDPGLRAIIDFIEKDELPEDAKLAKKLTLEQDQYELIDGILHHENPANPGQWGIVVPKSLQLSTL